MAYPYPPYSYLPYMQGYNQPAQPMQQAAPAVQQPPQPSIKVRPVASEEEARGVPVEFDGSRYGRREYDDRDMSQYGNMGRWYGREAEGYDDYGKESRDRMGRRREAGARYEDDDDEDGGAYRFRMDGKLDMGKVGHVDKLTAPKAEEITRKMVNEDGSKGAHWNMDQTKQVMEQRGIQCDPVEFYIAMNMMYSDYYPVAKKLNVNSVDFYADMAKAFLDDKDAGKDKLAKYFAYVVK